MINIKQFVDSLSIEQLDELEKEIIKRKSQLIDKNDINTFTVKFFDKYLNFICSENKLLGYIDDSLLVGTIIDRTHIEFINFYPNEDVSKFYCDINLEKGTLDVSDLKILKAEQVVEEFENIKQSDYESVSLDSYNPDIYNSFIYIKNKHSNNDYINYIDDIENNYFKKHEKSR